MTKLNASPDRNTFQAIKYLERKAEEGKTPDNDEEVAAMMDYYKSESELKKEREQDPKWQENNMEYDLRSAKWICDKAKANELFDLIDKFAGYGFNKSHAAAYALLAYQTAWLKTHYPHEFYAAAMCFDMHQSEKLAVFVDDMRRNGVALEGPDINHSEAEFTVEPTEEGYAVRYALAGIRNVGEKAMDAIVAEREANGRFASLEDLFRRVPQGSMNRRQLEGLAGAGAFDALEPNRAKVLANADMLLAVADEMASRSLSWSAALQDLGTLLNRVAIAQPRLPADVRNIGVTVNKSSPDLMMVVNLTSPDNRYDITYLRNYGVLNIKDRLARIPGSPSCSQLAAASTAMPPPQIASMNETSLIRTATSQAASRVSAATAALTSMASPMDLLLAAPRQFDRDRFDCRFLQGRSGRSQPFEPQAIGHHRSVKCGELGQVGGIVAGGHDRRAKPALLGGVIDPGRHDRHPGAQGDVIKAGPPGPVAPARAFGRDHQRQVIGLGKMVCRLFDVIVVPL